MKFSEELITEAESNQLERELRADKPNTVFRNAQLTDANKKIIEKWAKQRLYQMTLKKERRSLHELRAQFSREFSYAGIARDVPAKDVKAFRYYLCQEVTKRATELLKNNFYVRLNAAIILANLNLTDEDAKKQIEEHAYAKAALPLVEVLKTKTGGGIDEQLQAVKIQAAIGLGRIGMLSPLTDLDVATRNSMADALIAQLQDPNAHEWYQKRLLDALGELDFQNDVNSGKPIILEALSEVLVDKERDLCVRARAARALGRCHLPPGINAEKLVFQILLLENEMALQYQKDPDAYYWLDCFSDLYFAFHPVSEQEMKLFGSKRPPGLNAKGLGNAVRDAYTELLPIASHVVTQDGWIPPKKEGRGLPTRRFPIN